ncbi:MAG: MBL fold metallo-hydrolase [Acidobacteria bacterium]|nr:MBL fold metallo-hydrolase [Acidobacteriota bacterium]
MAVVVDILGSGSAGNAALVSTSRTRLLFDIGFSKKELLRRLSRVCVVPQSLGAVFISHEHTDHISGLRQFCKEFPLPVFMTPGTSHAARLRKGPESVETLQAGQPVHFRDFVVVPVAVPHDAAEPVAFIVIVEGVKIALVTDLGELTGAVCEQLRGAHCLIVESNHDVEMLRVGPYPWGIKQRVMSAQGHLSNAATAEFLTHRYDGHAEYIVLAHLSQVNNHPDIARLTAEQALRARSGRSLFGSRLRMAFQDQPAESLYF